jgi:hypothetical protein
MPEPKCLGTSRIRIAISIAMSVQIPAAMFGTVFVVISGAIDVAIPIAVFVAVFVSMPMVSIAIVIAIIIRAATVVIPIPIVHAVGMLAVVIPRRHGTSTKGWIGRVVVVDHARRCQLFLICHDVTVRGLILERIGGLGGQRGSGGYGRWLGCGDAIEGFFGAAAATATND